MKVYMHALFKLQWGRDLAITESEVAHWTRGRHAGFNGAVTLRSRNADDNVTYYDLLDALQWGRDLAITEWHARCRRFAE